MRSLDTNVLYYATNASCPEHDRARRLVESIAESPTDWILADQVLFEYYRLVRNPAVVAKPLSAAEAAKRLRFFREELGCLHCAYDPAWFSQVHIELGRRAFAPARTFDLVLAITLKNNGVDTFYTRNVRDFAAWKWFSVVDPVASPTRQ